MFAQRRDFEFQPEAEPDIIRALLERLVQKVPGPAHRAALEVCALVRQTTEAHSARCSAWQMSTSLFEWLRGLSFIESERQGLCRTAWRARRSSPTCAGATPIGMPSCIAAPSLLRETTPADARPGAAAEHPARLHLPASRQPDLALVSGTLPSGVAAVRCSRIRCGPAICHAAGDGGRATKAMPRRASPSAGSRANHEE